MREVAPTPPPRPSPGFSRSVIILGTTACPLLVAVLCVTALRGSARPDAAPAAPWRDPEPSSIVPAQCGLPAIAIDLHGEPKSGTTWLSLLLVQVLRLACKRAPDCETTSVNTIHRDIVTRWGRSLPGCNASGAVDVGDVGGADGPATQLTFSAAAKHHLPATHECVSDPRWKPLELTQRGSAGISNKFACEYDPAFEQNASRGGARPPPDVSSCFPREFADCCRAVYARTSSHRRYVLILRDPRDLAVSASYYGGHRDAATRDAYVARTCRVFTGWEAARYWWHMRLLSDTTLLIYYEALLLDPIAELTRFSQFLGFAFDPRDVNSAVHSTSADTMKKLEKNGKLDPATKTEKNNAKVRSAGNSTFEDELSAATVASCTQKMRVMLPAHVFNEFERLHKIRRKSAHGTARRRATARQRHQ